LQRFFDPAQYRRAWNEVELTGGEGELQRIDRLVELDSAFWVLDYKSSGSDSARLADYQAQVAAYCRAVSGVFPGSQVRGALIFSDASFHEVC
jgi:ATP-dependent helicase/nuclease subunit A